MIGDADDGYVVQPRRRAGILAARLADRHRRGAVRSRRTSRAKAGALDGKTVTLLGVERGAPARRSCAAARPRAASGRGCSSRNPATTCWARRFETPDEVRLLVDAGPLGYLSIAAHGHADALSFVLSIGDREILVDPGTYAYHTDPAWRRYFRSTLAHNTVGIDEQDQSVQAGNFMWTDHAQARCIEFEAGAERQRFVGEHYGYERLEDPVVHRREIVFDARAAAHRSDRHAAL